ncbi:MAG: hypothetical protein ABSG65_03870 [Bryobacteraceae bacterium]|jgi:hypothetical protein
MTYFQGHPVRRAIYNGEAVEYIGDTVVVKLKKQAANDPRAHRGVLESLPHQSTLERGFNTGGRATIRLPEGADPMVVAKRLASREDVEFAEPAFLHSGE